jgi:hypothetical protein
VKDTGPLFENHDATAQPTALNFSVVYALLVEPGFMGLHFLKNK